MAGNFLLTILSPEEAAFEGEVSSLIVPCQSGYLGVMAGHAPFAGLLRPGKIFFRKKSAEEVNFLSRSKGFLEVRDNKAVILLETAPQTKEER